MVDERRHIDPAEVRMKERLEDAIERDKEALGEEWDKAAKIEKEIDRLSQENVDRVLEYANKHDITFIEAKRIVLGSRTRSKSEKRAQTLLEVF